jgi:hypothetical protein
MTSNFGVKVLVRGLLGQVSVPEGGWEGKGRE